MARQSYRLQRWLYSQARASFGLFQYNNVQEIIMRQLKMRDKVRDAFALWVKWKSARVKATLKMSVRNRSRVVYGCNVRMCDMYLSVGYELQLHSQTCSTI